MLHDAHCRVKSLPCLSMTLCSVQSEDMLQLSPLPLLEEAPDARMRD